MEWAPSKEAPPVLLPVEEPAEEYGPWQWAASFGRATGRFGAEAFTLQENGRLRCPAGASLWLSEVRQENAFTQRAVSPFLPDRLSAVFPAGPVLGIRGQRRSGAPRKSGPPPPACSCRCCAKAHYARIDTLGRCGRSRASPCLDCPLAPTICRGASLGSNPAGGQASSSSTPCRPFASSLELAGSARTQRLVGTSAGAHHGRWRTRVSHHQRALGGIGKHRSFFHTVSSPRLRRS